MTEGYALRLSAEELRRYAAMAEAARESESDLWAAAGITEGASVADVGCGPGAMFPALVSAVGPHGRVSAVDGDESAVAAARSVVDGNGWANISVRQGRAEDTGLEPASVDVVMMRHVLAHNGPDEQRIVDHLATLVRPGGHVFLIDIDGHSFRFRPTTPDLQSLNDAYLQFHEMRGNDLQPGLRLDQLLSRAGLEVVAYRGWFSIASLPPEARPPAWAAREAMIASGVATDADVARWDAALTDVGSRQPTIFAPLFGAVGRRAG